VLLIPDQLRTLEERGNFTQAGQPRLYGECNLRKVIVPPAIIAGTGEIAQVNGVSYKLTQPIQLYNQGDGLTRLSAKRSLPQRDSFGAGQADLHAPCVLCGYGIV